MGQLSFLLWHGFALAAISSLPSVNAYCYIDRDGFEHCTLSNGARVGIAIAIIVLALLFIAAALTYRRNRMRGNVTYVGAPVSNAQNSNYNGYNSPPNNYLPTYSPGYYAGSPQYPPPVHGYDPQSGFAPPSGPPPGYYPPPQGPPPGKV